MGVIPGYQASMTGVAKYNSEFELLSSAQHGISEEALTAPSLKD